MNPEHAKYILTQLEIDVLDAVAWPNAKFPPGMIACNRDRTACTSPECPTYPKQHPPAVICAPCDLDAVKQHLELARQLWRAMAN